MNTALMFSSVDRSLETPPEVFDPLHAEFQFGLDACATQASARCPVFITPEIDTLTQDWADWCGGRPVFMNPPYGDPEYPCRGAIRREGEYYAAVHGWTRNDWIPVVDAPRCKKKGCQTRGYHIDTYTPGILDFTAKASTETTHGVTTVALLPARTDTAWWHTYVWDADHHFPRPGVWMPRFYRGRIRFRRGTEILDSAPFPSVVLVFSQTDEIDADF